MSKAKPTRKSKAKRGSVKAAPAKLKRKKAAKAATPKTRSRPAASPKTRKAAKAKAKETLRRERISLALKRFHEKRKTFKTYLEGHTKSDRAWGKKIWEEAKKAQKEAKRKPPKIRKKDRKLIEVPAGYTDLGKEKIGQVETVLNRALQALGTEETAKALSLKAPLSADLRTHLNSDDSFDAELRVKEIPRGLRIHDLAIFMESLIDPIPSTVLSIGFRSAHTEEFDKKKYEKHGGKVQVQTNYFRSRKKAIAFATVRQIHSRFMDKRYHKPSEIYVRVHWSPHGTHPKRKR